jgi:tRNA pseudouridine13 synthase
MTDIATFSLDWPRTGTPPITQAVLRATPDDFLVEEQPRILPEGAGEHLWVHIRKRGANTEFVARALARAAGVPVRAVSFAGMKDRHAVALQWFSIHLPGKESPALTGLPEGVEVLAAKRHARKLQRGALAGNAFDIVLRDVVGDRAGVERRIEEIARLGVPNYFGEQRFGRGGENLARAQAMFAGEPVRDRHLHGIYLSSARAFLFNEVLGARVQQESWRRALEGETLVLNGSNSFFTPPVVDDVIEQRLQQNDVHPSGPLWGEGEPPVSATVLALERQCVDRYPALATGLGRERMKQERRALRLLPQNVSAEWLDAASIRLRFTLPSGCYATTVLRELASYRDAGTGGFEAL